MLIFQYEVEHGMTMKETKQLKKEMRFCQQLKIQDPASQTKTDFQNHPQPKQIRSEVSDHVVLTKI